MEFKGTPGPWEIGYFVRSDVFAKGGMKWVSTLVSDNLDGTEEDSANAKLVAAAPELLEAAIDFVRKVESGLAKSTDSYNKFKSAINKAIGE